MKLLFYFGLGCLHTIRINYLFDWSLEFKQIEVWGLFEWKLSLGRFCFWTDWSVIKIASFSWFSFRWRFKLLIFLRFWGNVLVDLASTCNGHWNVACILLTYGSEGDQTFFSIFKTETLWKGRWRIRTKLWMINENPHNFPQHICEEIS